MPDDDLSRDPRGIKDDLIGQEDVVESVFRDHQKQRRREPHQRVGSKPGAFLAVLALETDEGREQEGGAELEQQPH